MKIYNIVEKKFEEGELQELSSDHLIIFENHSEQKHYTIGDGSSEWVILENLSVGVGRVTLCKYEQSSPEFFFRSEGMFEEEIVEKFLDIHKKRKKNDS